MFELIIYNIDCLYIYIKLPLIEHKKESKLSRLKKVHDLNEFSTTPISRYILLIC